MKKFVFIILFPLNIIALILLLIYRRSFSLLWKNCCRFYPSCSNYASSAYKQLNFLHASFKVIIRLSKCQPLYNGQCIDELKK